MWRVQKGGLGLYKSFYCHVLCGVWALGLGTRAGATGGGEVTVVPGWNVQGSVRGLAEGWMGVRWFRVEGGASEAVGRGGRSGFEG